MYDFGFLIGAIILFVVVYGGYFLPTIIAYKKDKKNFSAILALNFLLGWTVLGWIGALIWSLTSDN